MSEKTNGYYETEIDLGALLSQGMVDDIFYLKDLERRKFFLNCEINSSTVGDTIRHIMQINREDEDNDIPAENRKPIILYLNSPGGEVDAGQGLIDVIQVSKTPVYTVNIAQCYSMALYIFLAGHKRYAMPGSKFLLHDGSISMGDSSMKMQDLMAFQRRVEDRMERFVIEHSNITKEEYAATARVELYLFADEAKEKGMVDHILGTDCPLTEVI